MAIISCIQSKRLENLHIEAVVFRGFDSTGLPLFDGSSDNLAKVKELFNNKVMRIVLDTVDNVKVIEYTPCVQDRVGTLEKDDLVFLKVEYITASNFENWTEDWQVVTNAHVTLTTGLAPGIPVKGVIYALPHSIGTDKNQMLFSEAFEKGHLKYIDEELQFKNPSDLTYRKIYLGDLIIFNPNGVTVVSNPLEDDNFYFIYR